MVSFPKYKKNGWEAAASALRGSSINPSIELFRHSHSHCLNSQWDKMLIGAPLIRDIMIFTTNFLQIDVSVYVTLVKPLLKYRLLHSSLHDTYYTYKVTDSYSHQSLECDCHICYVALA